MTTTPRSSTATLIKALEILSRDIQSDDGVANAAIAEAAQRLGEMVAAGDKLAAEVGCSCGGGESCYRNQLFDAWEAVSR